MFIDGSKIADYAKAMPATLLFNAMSFSVMGGASEEKDKFYVSKIRISKE